MYIHTVDTAVDELTAMQPLTIEVNLSADDIALLETMAGSESITAKCEAIIQRALGNYEFSTQVIMPDFIKEQRLMDLKEMEALDD